MLKSRNRNRNFSKVGTRTVKNSHGSTTLSATLVVHIKAISCLVVAMCGLEAECGQLEDDIALDLEEAAPDEAPRLQVEQLHRLIVRQVRDGLCDSKKK